MSRLARHVKDKHFLRIIRRFLEAGLMQGGVSSPRYEGVPQGGPLSPILSNLLLDDLDKELERRGHCFVRYADDCNIYVRSQVAGERVYASITQFLEAKLKLRVNRKKSAVAPVGERTFLGHRIFPDGGLGVAPENRARANQRIRDLTKRNRGVSLQQVVDEVNSYLRGWIGYFRFARCKTYLSELGCRIRRRLRCFRLKQLKRTYTIAQFLLARGVSERLAWNTALSGKGWWRLAGSEGPSRAMPNAWLEEEYSLLDPVCELARYDPR